MHFARRLRNLFAILFAAGWLLLIPALAQTEESADVGAATSEQPPLPTNPPSPMNEEARQNVNSPCLEPPPMVRVEDYRGPMQKAVGIMARKLERRAVPTPHYRPGVTLCSLEIDDKLKLFVGDTFETLSLLGVAYDSGLDQAANSDPTFGQGATGYGRRFGANFASRTSTRFFTEFAYPTLFREDPRYYRLAHGTFSQRLIHAMGHTVIAHRDSGRHMFNFSEWLGAATGSVISNAYHPGNERGFGPAAQGATFTILTDMGFDMLREFWPELARKFHMPFRGANEPALQPVH
ncbi:MAG: hypothetical protein ABL995_00625 [Bryobacteraceae bacterium]